MGGLKQGVRVFGNWKQGGVWYPGVIINVDGNKIFVRYDDGDEEMIISSNLIQKDRAAKKYFKIDKIKKGHRILGHWKKGGKWYAGEVKDVDDKKERVKVVYDDGDAEWITDFTLIQKDKTREKLDLEDFKEGMRIIGNWKSGGTWYNGVIEKIKDGEIYVKYDDGDKEKISNFNNIQIDE